MDVSIGNLETVLHCYSSPAAAVSGGTWLQADPEVAVELRELGFDMVARANNHAMDYGPEALLQTTRALDSAGLRHAGAGSSIEEALRPAFYDTPHGRIALISVSSTLPIGSEATRSRSAIPARPGVAPLRHQRRYLLPQESFSSLRDIARECFFDKGRDPSRITIDPYAFAQGDGYKVESSPDEEDLDAVVAAIGEARRVADVIVVSVHSQESEGDWEQPAAFLRAATQRMAEAGASIVFGHGPHLLRGIEVHRGVPILYSLGSLFFQNDSVARHPDDARRAVGVGLSGSDLDIEQRKFDFTSDDRFWRTVVVVFTWRPDGGKNVSAIPFGIDRSHNLATRGTPGTASPDEARLVIDKVVQLSRALGTEVRADRTGVHLEIEGSRAGR